MKTPLKPEDFSPEEMEKCKSDPVYFYNTYVLPEGEQPLTREQYDAMLLWVERVRNGTPPFLRHRRRLLLYSEAFKKDGFLEGI